MCRKPNVDLVDTAETAIFRSNWGQPGKEKHPVNNVDWYDAKTFSEWVGGRLPTEAEWEYAARSGGRDIIYPWGDERPGCRHAVVLSVEDPRDYSLEIECDVKGTAEVCSSPLGDTTHGLCDMAGNVEEWIEDSCHDSYEGAPNDGSAWDDVPIPEYRVTRGGSYSSTESYLRSASRGCIFPDYQNANYGFRVVIDSE